MPKYATSWCLLFVCLPGFALAQGAPKDIDILARQVLAALAAKDQTALHSLRIDRGEFKRYIWPTFAVQDAGEARAYAIYSQNSDAGLKNHLATFGGAKFEVIAVKTGPAKQYKGYRVLPNPEVNLRGEDGQEQVLKLGAALLDHDGQIKIASYFRSPTAASSK
jgi:hypothetical protein